MRCPECKGDAQVADSRRTKGGAAVRRRRECTACGFKFTTYEVVDSSLSVTFDLAIQGGRILIRESREGTNSHMKRQQ